MGDRDDRCITLRRTEQLGGRWGRLRVAHIPRSGAGLCDVVSPSGLGRALPKSRFKKFKGTLLASLTVEFDRQISSAQVCP